MNNMMRYLTPEDLVAGEEMAGINNPEDEMLQYAGMQRMVNGMGVNALPERGNSRVIGVTSPLEAIGGIAQNAAQAYGNSMLASKYGKIFDANSGARKKAYRDMTAKYRADALRNVGIEPFDNAAYGTVADQIDP